MSYGVRIPPALQEPPRPPEECARFEEAETPTVGKTSSVNTPPCAPRGSTAIRGNCLRHSGDATASHEPAEGRSQHSADSAPESRLEKREASFPNRRSL